AGRADGLLREARARGQSHEDAERSDAHELRRAGAARAEGGDTHLLLRAPRGFIGGGARRDAATGHAAGRRSGPLARGGHDARRQTSRSEAFALIQRLTAKTPPDAKTPVGGAAAARHSCRREQPAPTPPKNLASWRLCGFQTRTGPPKKP